MSGAIPSNNPTGYLGLPERNPPEIITTSRDPRTTDYKNVKLGDFWFNKTTNKFWILVSLANNTATWDPFAGPTAGTIDTLTGDSGGAVTGDTNGNVNLLGTAGQITVTGNPSTNTLTLALASGGTPIDSFIPDSGTSPVVPTAAGVVTMTGGNGVTTVGGTNQLTFDMESPFTGDFTFRSTTSGDTETLTVSNTSNTASSQAQLNLSVAGTSAGDAYTTYTVSGTTNWSEGVDNSDSDKYKLSASTALGTSDVITATTAGNVQVVLGDFDVIRSNSGGGVSSTSSNTSNTADSNAAFTASVAGTSAGDCWNQWTIGSTISYGLGPDTSVTRQPLKLNYAAASSINPSTGTNLLTIDSAGTSGGNPLFTVTGGQFILTTGNALDVTEIISQNTNTEFARFRAIGTSPKTGYFSCGTTTPLYWNFGMASTLSNAFCLNTGNSPAAPEGGTITFNMSTAGELNLPLQPAFFAFLSAATANDKTGDGTGYTVVFDSEAFDQGTDFDTGTGTFTVPKTGKYKLTANVLLANLGAAHNDGQISIIVAGTTAYQFSSSLGNPGAVRNASNQYSLQVTAFATLTAADTVTVRVTVAGGTKTVGVFGAASPNFWTYFEGSLIC